MGWGWLGSGAQNGKIRPQTASFLPPHAHCNPCLGTLYRYTLLLYGTTEDMTARPMGPQVTSSACVQRDTEGLCQGECPARHGLLADCVCSPGWVGGPGSQASASPLCPCYLCRMPQPRLHPGPPLPLPLPTTVLQSHPPGHNHWAGAPGSARPACALQLPLLLLYLPRQLPT